MIRVLLVDDHPVVRAGLAGILHSEADLEVVGEAASANEAVAVARALAPDVVLMDLRMPGGDGVSATAGVLAAAPSSRVVVLTTYESDADILRAVEAGAAGYLLKDASRAELVGRSERRRAARRCSRHRSRPGWWSGSAGRTRPTRYRRVRSRCCGSWRGVCPTPTSGGSFTSVRRR